ncbi:predicted protein [Chaetomium globosum CBS 148.51]|uniref:Uncharacterized protein n=1 Tax=Chaetomium globosum (strain ATCC 6205 / CBS 148.51 / DSM 1962 / NBRC 6347 / NRRL 1970) TaxID=306901 RepID=Q2HGL5_CHAGB|nr:uncharacterized protein CHGG_00639 [Chaetomium globosum CBS 148.51]EAQ92404.1 predicted protein [Chaetomium globosum CBS 148.51]
MLPKLSSLLAIPALLAATAVAAPAIESARRPCRTGCLPDDLSVARLVLLDDVARHHHSDERLVIPRLRHFHQDRGGDSHHQHQDYHLLPGHHDTPGHHFKPHGNRRDGNLYLVYRHRDCHVPGARPANVSTVTNIHFTTHTFTDTKAGTTVYETTITKPQTGSGRWTFAIATGDENRLGRRDASRTLASSSRGETMDVRN